MRWQFALMVCLCLANACAENGIETQVQTVATPLYDQLNAETWIKIHQQQSKDTVTFSLQEHGGSAYDSRRQRLVLFGSNTHGEDWCNSPLFFDIKRLKWERLYKDDDPDTYTVNAAGIAVAGVAKDHPWAMHTFGSVVYDRARDQVVVSSMPKHMVPGRFTDALATIWSRIEKHPTWILDLKHNRWQALTTPAVDFFPYATVFDSDRQRVVGYRDTGVYELSGQTRQWQQTLKQSLLGFHNNAVYDSVHKAVVLFGSDELTNDIVVYEPSEKRQRRMPTPGLRPPKDKHVPMAFHRRLGKTVVVVDHRNKNGQRNHAATTKAQTWTYDLGLDQWHQIKGANFNFGLGMNYHLHYIDRLDVLLLVTQEPEQLPSVWAMRL